MPMFEAVIRGHWWVLALALLISFGLKLTLALNTYGTNDVVYWEESAKKISVQQELNLYREGNNVGNSQQAFNHPPFMLRVLHAWDLLAGVSGHRATHWRGGSMRNVDVDVSWKWQPDASQVPKAGRYSRPGIKTGTE